MKTSNDRSLILINGLLLLCIKYKILIIEAYLFVKNIFILKKKIRDPITLLQQHNTLQE